MNIMFAAMGAESISLEYLSSVLKAHGHKISLAFDRALFNDKQYFSVKPLAKFFSDKERVIKKIIDAKPQLLGFCVFADNYQWCLEISHRVKESIDVFTIFGGIHPTCLPFEVLSNDCVDFICLSEGEKPLLELVECIEKGQGDNFSIDNIWYKKNGEIIQNKLRPLMDPKDFPMPDKQLFEDYIPMDQYYLTVTSKGCIAHCAFCSENFLYNWEREHNLGSFLREKSVIRVIEELKLAKSRYKIRYVDMKNNVLTGSKAWLEEFVSRYKNEVGLPFRIMGHPLLLQKDACQKLKEAGCHHIQIGIETLNPKVRKEALLRNESNEDILNALTNMDEAGLGYSCDLMLGLPGESEKDIQDALLLFASLKNMRRASIFWLEYLPEVAITHMAFQNRIIDETDIKRINEGRQEHYLSTGSVLDKKRIKILKSYHILFRLSPIMPNFLMRLVLTMRLHYIFRFIPGQVLFIFIIDTIVSYVKKDYYAIFSTNWYFREMTKRLAMRLSVPLSKKN